MQFLFSSYNDYYVHPLFPSRFPSSSNNLIPFFLILILNNFFYALRLFFPPFADVAYSLSCIIVCVLSSSSSFPFSLYLSTKPLTTSTKFFIYLSSFFVFVWEEVGVMLYPTEKEVLVSYVTCREGSWRWGHESFRRIKNWNINFGVLTEISEILTRKNLYKQFETGFCYYCWYFSNLQSFIVRFMFLCSFCIRVIECWRWIWLLILMVALKKWAEIHQKLSQLLKREEFDVANFEATSFDHHLSITLNTTFFF